MYGMFTNARVTDDSSGWWTIFLFIMLFIGLTVTAIGARVLRTAQPSRRVAWIAGSWLAMAAAGLFARYQAEWWVVVPAVTSTLLLSYASLSGRYWLRAKGYLFRL